MSAIAHIYRPGVEQNMLYSWFSAMHTRVDIILISRLDKASMLTIVEQMKERISDIETMGNCFTTDSELSRFNAGELPCEALSAELHDILRQCDQWKEETGGLFDVTVEGGVNLSGFLKGYALDQMRPILENHGIADALLNFGNSSVMALGSQHNDGKGWMVENLNGEQFILNDECLTTSGNETPERRHIINPLTHEYVEGQRMVSVVTKNAAEGEVRSTVALLLSVNKT